MSERAAGGPRLTRADAALCAALCGAVGTMALARRSPAILLLCLPCAFGFFAPAAPVAPSLRAGAERVLWGILALMLVFGTAWAVYPALPESAVKVIPLGAGVLLALFGAGGLWARAAWPPGRGAVPATVGVLVVACFDPGVPVRLPVTAAAAALLVHLALDGRRPSVMRVGLFAVVAAALATFVAALLPWAQPHVEQAVADLTNPTSAVSSGTFSSTSRLGDVEDVSLSSQVLLRMWSRSPRKLRARVFTDFDGTTWRASKGAAEVRLIPVTAPGPSLESWLGALPGRSYGAEGGAFAPPLEPTKVILAEAAGGVLFTPARPVIVRLAGEPPRLGFGGVVRPGERAEIYGIVSRGGDGGGGETAAGAEALSVPPDTDPRMRDLAAALAAEAPTAAARIQRTLAELAGRCQYALHVGRFRTRQPVAEFLFEKKRGYCEYFASAAALLLRLQGVPTRYVTGLNVLDDDARGDHYVVPGSDAHAWIDAFVPERGWVEVDPTPAAQFAAVHPPLSCGALASFWERLQAGWAEVVARWRSGDSRGLVVPAAALALLGLALAAWRRRRTARGRSTPATLDGTLPPEIRELLGRVDRIAARRGFPRPAWRAPLEHLALLPQGTLSDPLRDAAREAVLACYRARFGSARLEAAEADALRARLERASRPSAVAR